MRYARRHNIWFIAAIWIGLALVANLVSVRVGISVASIGILVGVAAGNIRLSDLLIQCVYQVDLVTLRADGAGRAPSAEHNLLQLLHFRCLHPPQPLLRSPRADGVFPVALWGHPGGTLEAP